MEGEKMIRLTPKMLILETGSRCISFDRGLLQQLGLNFKIYRGIVSVFNHLGENVTAIFTKYHSMIKPYRVYTKRIPKGGK